VNAVTVVGNPRLGSRTRRAAELVVGRLTGSPPTHCLELAELGPALLEWDDPGVSEAKKVVLGAELLVFASPTFKATYTGLLKLFLDQFAAGEVPGTPAVALMLGGSTQHALAGELTLKPVLTEIGCSCPAPALFLLESTWDCAPELEPWLVRASKAHRLDLGPTTG
jgi:FMN reductase